MAAVIIEGSEMTFLRRFFTKLRPDVEYHERLRGEADKAESLAHRVRQKRERFERDFPEREFPVAGLIERRWQENP